MASMNTVRELSAEFVRQINTERLVLMRNLAFGAGTIALIVILAIYQVGLQDLAAIRKWLADNSGNVLFPWKAVGGEVALLGASIALPAWIALASIWESYIFAGESCYPYMRSRPVQLLTGLTSMVAGVGQVAAVAGILMYLLPAASYVFGASAVVCVLLYEVHYFLLQHWWRRSIAKGG